MITEITADSLRAGDEFITKQGWDSSVKSVESNGVLVTVFHQRYSDMPVQMSTYSPTDIVPIFEVG